MATKAKKAAKTDIEKKMMINNILSSYCLNCRAILPFLPSFFASPLSFLSACSHTNAPTPACRTFSFKVAPQMQQKATPKENAISHENCHKAFSDHSAWRQIGRAFNMIPNSQLHAPKPFTLHRSPFTLKPNCKLQTAKEDSDKDAFSWIGSSKVPVLVYTHTHTHTNRQTYRQTDKQHTHKWLNHNHRRK